MVRFSLGSASRLKSPLRFADLFESGKSIPGYPVSLVYNFSNSGELDLKAGFTVSKRKFKKAVDRNLLKRRMRESYRLKKPFFEDALHTIPVKLEIIFIYRSEVSEVFIQIDSCIQDLLNKLEKRIKKSVKSKDS